MFWEIPIQRFFMSYPHLMTGINWLYSFIHIPGTIAFLVWLYYYTITSNRLVQHSSGQIGGQGHAWIIVWTIAIRGSKTYDGSL